MNSKKIILTLVISQLNCGANCEHDADQLICCGSITPQPSANSEANGAPSAESFTILQTPKTFTADPKGDSADPQLYSECALEECDQQKVTDAADPQMALMVGEIIKTTQETIDLAKSATGPGIFSSVSAESVEKIHIMLHKLSKEFKYLLPMFIQSLKETHTWFNAHKLAGNGLQTSVLHNSSITPLQAPQDFSINFDTFCEDKKTSETSEDWPLMRGGHRERNKPIPLKEDEVIEPQAISEAWYIALQNTPLPAKCIKSPIPNGLSNKQIIALMLELKETLAHLNIEVPVDLKKDFGMTQGESAKLNEELRSATIVLGGFRVNVGTIYECSTEFASIAEKLDVEWCKAVRDHIEITRKCMADRSTFEDPGQLENVIKSIEGLKEFNAELKKTEKAKTSSNTYRSVSLLGILAKLYAQFHNAASINKKRLGHEGSEPYFTLLSKLCSVVMLELSHKHTIPQNMTELLAYIEQIPNLFKEYIEYNTEHGREARTIAIHNIVKVMLQELRVLKYNVEVELARNNELVTADELVWHFIKIYKACLDLKHASRNNIKENNYEFLSACVFEERKPNPELEQEGPAIISATEKLLETLQGCYDQLGDVELTDQGARIIPRAAASAPENSSRSE